MMQSSLWLHQLLYAEPFQQQFVIDHVEGCRDVETDQSDDRPTVNVREDIVDVFHQSSLGRPAGEVSRLQYAVIW